MSVWELLLIAVGLSMDAFAVSICKGLGMKKMNYPEAGAIAFFFGFFQAAMPLAGWALGKQFESYITNVDHWIAFLLLALIGINMIFDALRDGDDAEKEFVHTNVKELVILSVATSIDALAVGITFAFLPSKMAILPAVLLIGAITFCLSFSGVIIGNQFGIRYKKRAQMAGGLILVMIGLKILAEHLGFLPI